MDHDIERWLNIALYNSITTNTEKRMTFVIYDFTAVAVVMDVAKILYWKAFTNYENKSVSMVIIEN